MNGRAITKTSGARRVSCGCVVLAFAMIFGSAARAQQEMVTVAGITSGAPLNNYGTQTTSPSNATQTGLHFPNAVAVDQFGNFYIADGLNGAIREVSCGNMFSYANLLSAPVNDPAGTEATAVATDPEGDVFYADSLGNIFQNTANLYPLNLEGGLVPGGYYIVPKQIASLGQWVLAMTADSQGNLYVLSGTNNLNGGYTNIGITKIVPPNSPEGTATLTTISTANQFAPAANNFDSLVSVGGLAIDAAGNLYTYVYDGSASPNPMYNQILQITQSGTISDFGFTGFDQINGPIVGSGLALAQNSAAQAEAGLPGTFYMAFNNTGRIYAFVPPNGEITPSSFTDVAGTDRAGFNGDGPATESELNGPFGLGLDPAGALYIADTGNNLVRRVANSGYVSGSCGAFSLGTNPSVIPNFGFGRFDSSLDKYYLAVDRGNYTNGGPLGAVVAYNGIDDTVDGTMVIGSLPQDMAVDPVNYFVYTANSDGTISVIDSMTDTLLTSFATGSRGLTSIAVDPGTNLVYAVGNEDTAIYILQGPTRESEGGPIVAPAQLLTPIGNLLPLGSVAVDTQRHMAYAIVDGPAPLGELNYSIAVINGTTSQPTLANTVSYLPNASSTNIAHDALGVETTSGDVIIADSEDQNVTTFLPTAPADAAFEHAPMSFYPTHIAIDSVHQNVYISDGYGNAVVRGVVSGSQATISSTLSPISVSYQGCGAGAGAVGVDASVDQAYVTTCDPTAGGEVLLWDGTLQKVISTYPATYPPASAGVAFTNASITVNPFIHSVYVNEALPSPTGPEILVFNGPTNPAAANLTISPNPLYIAPVPVGSAPTGTITVVNSGNAPGAIAAGVVNAVGGTPTIVQNGDCEAGETCTFTVTLPVMNTAGSYSGTIVFSDSALDTPQLVPYSGTVGITSVSFNPTSVAFGTVPVDVSASASIVVTNTGSGPLKITNVAFAAGAASDLSTYNNCEVSGSGIAAGGSCTITVEYNPVNPDAGNATDSGTLVITDNVPGSPQMIPVSATAVSDANSGTFYGYGIFAGTALNFGNIQVNEPSVTQQFYIENEGEGTLGIGSVAISGANAGDFHLLGNNCGSSLAPFAECAMDVYFMPTTTATESEMAQLVISESNSTVAAQTITLLGTSSTALGPPTSLPELVSADNSVPQNPAAPSNGGVLQTPGAPSISSGGQFVAFSFQATNLPGAYQSTSSPLSSVYLRNTCVNQAPSCEQGTNFVAFGPATGPGANGGAACGGQSLSPGNEFPAIDTTGRYVAFTSDGCVPAGTTTTTTNQIFLRDTNNQSTSVVSLDSTTNPVSLGVAESSGAFPGINPFAMSANARFFAYETTSPNVVSGVANASALNEIYWQDACTGQSSGCLATQLVSQPSGTTNVVANATAEEPSISPDGRYVGFASTATNLATNASAVEQAYLRDTCYGATSCTPSTTLISALANGTAAGGSYPSVSSGGRFVAFVSSNSGLITGANAPSSPEAEIFLQDTCESNGAAVGGCTASTTLLSQFNGNAASGGNSYPFISADGRLITFTSISKLTSTATTGNQWVYKYDTCESNGVAVGGGCTAGLTLISSNPTGGTVNGGGDAVVDATDEFVVYDQGSANSNGYPVAEVELGSATAVGTSPLEIPTTTTLAISTPGPVTLGQALTLTATVAATTGSGTPTGTVTFVSGTTQLRSPVALVSGVATLQNFTGLPAGVADLITASYNGSPAYSVSTSAATTIDVGPPIATFSPTTVSFPVATLDLTSTQATVTLTNSAAAGSQPLILALDSVTPDAASGFGLFNNVSPFGVNSSNVTCNGAPAAFAPYITPLTINPGVSCTFPLVFDPGDSDVTSTSNQNQSDTLIFNDNAPTSNAPFEDEPAASVPNAQDAQTITLEGTFLYPAKDLVTGPSSAAAGTPVTFTATVTKTLNYIAQAPTGTVTFLAGGTALSCTTSNPAPIVAGTATCTTSSLPVGVNAVTAAYSGDTNYGATTSAAIGVTVTGTGPTLVSIAVSPANPTIAVSGSQQFTAAGTYSNSSIVNPLTGVTWSVTNVTPSGVASINPTTGLAMAGTTAGTATIMAAVGGISGTTTLTVTAAAPPPTPVPASDSEPITVTDFDAVTPLINVAAPVVFFSTNSLGFGSASGTQAITVSNIGTGSTALMLSSAMIPSGSGFALGAIACSNGDTGFTITLPSGGACEISVTYTAPGSGSANATLTFTDNAALSNLTSTPSGSTYTQTIALLGAGTTAAAPPAPPATVDVTDNESITVTDAPQAQPQTCPVITVTPSGALAASLGVAYSQQFAATGSTATPLTWSLGGAPSWLSISSTGLVSGTPAATGTFPFTVTATDKNGCTGIASVSVTVTPKPVATTTAITSTSSSDNGLALPPNTALIENPLTVSFRVLPASGSAAPTGTVKVTVGVSASDGCVFALVASANGVGSCSMTISPTASTTTSLTATYTPDSTATALGLMSSASPAFTETIAEIDGCGTLPMPQTATQGSTSTYTFSICLASNVTAAASAVVTGCPPSAECSDTITPVAGAPGVYTLTVTIVTGASSRILPVQYHSPRGKSWPYALSGLAGALLGILMALLLARQRTPRTRLAYRTGLLVALLLVLSGISGCVHEGSGGNNSGGTPPNSYTVVVSITAGNVSILVPLEITVTK